MKDKEFDEKAEEIAGWIQKAAEFCNNLNAIQANTADQKLRFFLMSAQISAILLLAQVIQERPYPTH
jgi:hypothetical protein